MLPFRGNAADAGLAAIGEDDEAVIPENLGDGIFIVRQILIVGSFKCFMRCLQFNEQQGNAINKADKISPAFIHITAYPELGGQEEVIIQRE